MHALSLLALFLPLVAARFHKQCGCRTYTAAHGWETNTVLAHFVCYSFFSDIALWDTKAQRCVERRDSPEYMINGQTWEDQCKFYGTQEGYYPINDKGVPVVSGDALVVDIALGQCFD